MLKERVSVCPDKEVEFLLNVKDKVPRPLLFHPLSPCARRKYKVKYLIPSLKQNKFNPRTWDRSAILCLHVNNPPFPPLLRKPQFANKYKVNKKKVPN